MFPKATGARGGLNVIIYFLLPGLPVSFLGADPKKRVLPFIINITGACDIFVEVYVCLVARYMGVDGNRVNGRLVGATWQRRRTW